MALATPRGERGNPPDTPPGRAATPPGQGTPPPRPITPPGRPDTPAPPRRNPDQAPPDRLQACGPRGPFPVGPGGLASRTHAAQLGFGTPPSRGRATTAPWARMSYFWIGARLEFVFNGHGLGAGTQAVLAADAGDGTVLCLARGNVGRDGQLSLLGQVDPDSHLPPGLDPFLPWDRANPPADTRVRLLPAAAVDCLSGVVGLAPGDPVLESVGGLRFVDTDVLVCPNG